MWSKARWSGLNQAWFIFGIARLPSLMRSRWGTFRTFAEGLTGEFRGAIGGFWLGVKYGRRFEGSLRGLLGGLKGEVSSGSCLTSLSFLGSWGVSRCHFTSERCRRGACLLPFGGLLRGDGWELRGGWRSDLEEGLRSVLRGDLDEVVRRGMLPDRVFWSGEDATGDLEGGGGGRRWDFEDAGGSCDRDSGGDSRDAGGDVTRLTGK